MIEVKLGAATATRIEETYEPNFDAKVFFPDWNPEVVQRARRLDAAQSLRRGVGLAEAQRPQLAADGRRQDAS